MVKKTPFEGGDYGNHVHGSEVLKSCKCHKHLEAVIRENVVGNISKAAGLVNGGNLGPLNW
jgi:hypothetical protein